MAVQIEQTATKGEGLFTTRPCPPGTALLAGHVVAACLHVSEWEKYCDWCCSPLPPDATRCPCGLSYCSPACQSAARVYHADECEKLASLAANPLLPTVLLLHRMLCTAVPAALATLAWTTPCVEQCVALFHHPAAAVQHAADVVRANCFFLANDVEETIGVVLYDAASKANHSCRPTAIPLRDGRSVTVTALRDIPKGEEVTFSYVDCALPYDRRTAALRQWGFHCTCERCKADEQFRSNERFRCPCGGAAVVDPVGCWGKCDRCGELEDDVVDDLLFAMEEANRHFDSGEAETKHRRWAEALREFGRAHDAAAPVLLPSHPFLFITRSGQFQCLLALKHWDEACTLGEALSPLVDGLSKTPVMVVTDPQTSIPGTTRRVAISTCNKQSCSAFRKTCVSWTRLNWPVQTHHGAQKQTDSDRHVYHLRSCCKGENTAVRFVKVSGGIFVLESIELVN